MAPPHYEMINARSGAEIHFTYLGDDEGVSVLAVIEMATASYTNFVSGEDNRMVWTRCVPKPRALTMSCFSRNDTGW